MVRPPTGEDTARFAAAQVALEQRHADLVEDVGERVSVTSPGYAFSYTVAVLESDDAYGRAHGWVTRGDLVRWSDLVIAARAAAGQLDAEHDGRHPVDCAGCDLRRAVGRLRESTRTAQRAGVPLRST